MSPRPAAAAWDPRAIPDQTDRVYLITGSNAGLGYFSAEQLTGAGAHVIMTGRNPNRLAAARAAVNARVEGASVETLLLDTSNLGSIRAAAASVRTHPRLDGLLLNAGITDPPKTRETTVDGHEMILATNVLGHFALAGELLAMLAASPTKAGRMVWLGSMSTSMWRYDPVDLQLEQNYTAWRAYVQSKVATQALAIEANRRLESAGVPVASVIAHPGYSTSGRTVGIRGVNEPSRMTRFLDNLQVSITQPKDHGAWPLVRALTDPDSRGGDMWGPSAVAKGEPRRARVPRISSNAEIGARIWTECEDATGVHWPFALAAEAGLPR